MKYFKQFDDDVFYEMFNIEAGAEVFKQTGIVDDIKNAKKYPIFTVDGISTYIKTTIAYVYIKNELITSFVESYVKKVAGLEKQFAKLTGYEHLSNNTNVRRLSHFVNVKSRCKQRDTVTEYQHNSNKRAIIRKTLLGSHEENCKVNRFTWVICDIENLIYNMESKWSDLHFTTQLTSIIIDKNLITKPNGFIFTNNIVFDDLYFTKRLSKLTSKGYITNEEVKQRIENKDESALYYYYADILNFPEFLLAWECWSEAIVYCAIRHFDVEINNHLKMNNQIGLIDNFIEFYNKKIYEIDFKKIIIANANDNNRCDCCLAILYEDIYVIFENTETNICKAFCHICMHSFRNSGGFAPEYAIGRTKYPRTLAQALALSNIDDTVRQICMVNKNIIEKDDKAVFITINNKNYLLWGGSISGIYKYLDNENYITRKLKKPEKIKQYLDNVEIVRIEFYEPTIHFI